MSGDLRCARCGREGHIAAHCPWPVVRGGVVGLLGRVGAVSALHLARVLGQTVEAVYVELVREEAAGRVRVNVDGNTRRCTWEAMVPDHELPAALRGGALEVF